VDTKSLKLESILNNWTMKNPNVALLTEDGLTLVSSCHHVADLCSLPSAVQITQQYLKLKVGELAICNDPYTGGSIQSQITLVTSLELGKNKDKFLLGIRIATRPLLNFGKTVDEDGLKIPPTPLGTLDGPAAPVLDAIGAHPMAPDDFQERMKRGILDLKRAKASLTAAVDMFDLEMGRALAQAYVQDSHEYMKALLGEFPHGHSEVQWNLEGGEKLRLKIENTGSRLDLDFAGTTNIKDLSLTEAHVLGCAARVLEQFSNHSVPVNSGSLLVFNLAVPKHSAVSSSSPSSTTLGVLVGTTLICDLISRAFALLNSRRKNIRAVSSPMLLTFKFGTRRFYDLLASGTLATAEKRGEAGVDTWNESGLSPSIEDVEARFPIEILALKKRTDSGGQGDQKGGDGVLKTYQLMEPAVLRWFAGYSVKNETNTNSGLGMAPEIIVKIGDEEQTHTNLKGEISLPKGAIVTALSRGGHAFSKD
jgi:N-methylhydantoinase B